MAGGELKALRRAGTDALLEQRRQRALQQQQARAPPHMHVLDAMLEEVAERGAAAQAEGEGQQGLGGSSTSSSSSSSSSRSGHRHSQQQEQQQQAARAADISVLCRTPQQVEAALSVPWLKEVAIDFLEVQVCGGADSWLLVLGRQLLSVWLALHWWKITRPISLYSAVVATPRATPPHARTSQRCPPTRMFGHT